MFFALFYILISFLSIAEIAYLLYNKIKGIGGRK